MLPQYATSNLVEWQPTFDAHIGETLAYLNALGPNKSVDILGLVAHGLIDVSAILELGLPPGNQA